MEDTPPECTEHPDASALRAIDEAKGRKSVVDIWYAAHADALDSAVWAHDVGGYGIPTIYKHQKDEYKYPYSEDGIRRFLARRPRE
jgi:hypothetical protein